MLSRDPIELPSAALLVAGAVLWWTTADFFGHEILTEVAIFAIFAMSLDLLVGYAGMVSLGQAAFLASGAYVTAALTVFLGWPVSAAALAAVVASALLAALVGVFAVRLGGVFFIMITLAIGQMAYAYFFKARAFGADDGMSGIPRPDLSVANLQADEPAVFSALVLVLTVIVWLVLRVVVRSPFGAMLIAIHQNENRLRSLGCPVLRYKLAAYVLAGGVGGIAGAMTAQHTGFVSPDLAFWTVSGELLIMVIVGGMGSLLGAIAGAATLVLLRHNLSDGGFWEGLGLASSVADYWQFIMGLFFVGVVLFAGDGLYGRLRWAWQRVRRHTGTAGAGDA
jgi:branched-chain amino acid transport system permease protein